MKHIYTIGAALLLMALIVIPASAGDLITIEAEVEHSGAGCIWHNGKCLAPDDYKKVVGTSTVIHNEKTGVDSKYRDTNPAKGSDVFVGSNTCTVEGNVRAGYNTLTREVMIANALSPNDTTIIPILPDGTFRYDGLAAGNYILKIVPQHDGLGPEQVSRLHCERGVARPESELLGYAITTDGPAVCQREILKASYGAFEERCTETTEYRYWIISHDHQCVPGIGAGCGMWAKEVEVDTSHWSEWQTEEPDHCIYMSAKSMGYGYKFCEQQIVEECETVGGSTDVTSNVREALGKGYASFLFRNDRNPGGIFDITSTTLLSTIDDPAPGIVKHVSIDYKDCNGIEQHVSAEEYQQITLL